MNPLAFLVALFGSATVILAYAVVAYRDAYLQMRDDYVQMRDMQSGLVDSSERLLAHCDELERYNGYLEAEVTRLNDLRAAAMMFVPRYRVQGEKMSVGVEAP